LYVNKFFFSIANLKCTPGDTWTCTPGWEPLFQSTDLQPSYSTHKLSTGVSELFCSKAVRGLDILRFVIVSGYVTTSTKKQAFCKYIIFSLLTKCLRGSDEIVLRDRFGPQPVVWRP